MHPNLFMQTFWQMTLRPEVFVAMSFKPEEQYKFNNIIKPAINSVRLGGKPLTASRVDISKRGESILTEIIDGIAHCQIFLADISVIGNDSISGESYRNGNVMYEVGLAIACRQPCEVLLIRDDSEKMLFDVSTIPHFKVNFKDTENAVAEISTVIEDRLSERKLIYDARVEKIFSSLSKAELAHLKAILGKNVKPGNGAFFSFPSKGIQLQADFALAISRLLDKGVMYRVPSLAIETKTGDINYAITPLGRGVLDLIEITEP